MKTKLVFTSLLLCLFVKPCGAQEFNDVDTPPVFRGGDIETFTDWVFKKVIYSFENQVDFGEEGVVTVSFTVDKKGKVKNISVESTFDKYLADRVISAINKAPKWTPATAGGKPTEVGMTANIELRYELVNASRSQKIIELKEGMKDPIKENGKMPVFSKQYADNQVADENEFRSWLQTRIAKVAGTEYQKLLGRLTLHLVVNTGGYVEDVFVKETSNPRLGRIAVDILYSSPKWYSPGYYEGKPVRIQYELPVVFRLFE